MAGSLRGQPVADAGFGQEEAGSSGIGFDLAAQLGHVDAKVMRLENAVRPPDFFKQLPVG